MPGIVGLVAAISTNLNAARAAANLPTLTDGGIVIGKVFVDENTAPPRVIFVPKGPVAFSAPSRPNMSPTGGTGNASNPGAGVRSVLVTQFGSGYTLGTCTISFSAPQLAGGAAPTAVPVLNPSGGIKAIALTSAGSGYTSPPTVTIADSGAGAGALASANIDQTAEKNLQLQQGSIFTEHTRFAVHCWAQASPPDATNDFDACQQLYQQVIQSAWAIAPGAVQLSAGDWLDSAPNAAGVDLAGHYFVFGIEFLTPILRPSLTPAPVGTQPLGTTTILPFSGGSGESGPST